MKEFGSDFHYVAITNSHGKAIGDYFSDAVYYADGRQTLIDLYQKQGWKSLWVPDYFCYEVLAYLERGGITLKYYPDYPLADEKEVLPSLPYEEGDALLRMNYFGLRAYRSTVSIPVPVVEDHTHDLIGDWAVRSDADWCIASLRKTLPIAEGGMLWSPRGLTLPPECELTDENKFLASRRWGAMKKKSLYLENIFDDKSEFRNDMILTEEMFDGMGFSAIDDETREYLSRFDIVQWYRQRKTNWSSLVDAHSDVMTVLEPESRDCNPFSWTILFEEESERNDFRSYLIDRSIYPAILWNVPETKNSEAVSFSKRMLSLHCDGRYNEESMAQLSEIIAAYWS